MRSPRYSNFHIFRPEDHTCLLPRAWMRNVILCVGATVFHLAALRPSRAAAAWLVPFSCHISAARRNGKCQPFQEARCQIVPTIQLPTI